MSNKNNSRLKKLLYFMKRLYKNKQKWRRFKAYLESPLLANSTTYAFYLDSIEAVIKSKKTGKKAEEILCNLVFPEQDYEVLDTKTHLRRRLSAFLEHYYEYEAFLRFRKDKPMQWRYIIQEANDKHWDDYFEWLHEKKAKTAVDKLPRNVEYFIHQIDLSDQMDEYQNRQVKDASGIQNRYQTELKALNSLFALNLLKIACNIVNQNQTSQAGTAEMPPLLEPLLAEINHNYVHQEPLVKMYYLIYCCLVQPGSEQKYAELRSLVIKESTNPKKSEIRRLFQHTANLCIYLLNHFQDLGDKSRTHFYIDDLKQFYALGLRKGFFFKISGEKKHIDHREYKNIVLLFCKLGEYDWVQDFIDTYSSMILKEWGMVVGDFAMGILMFYKREFEEAQEWILKSKNSLKPSHDRYLSLGIKGYHVRILYELGLFEKCISETENGIRSIRFNQHLPSDYKQKVRKLFYHLQCLSKEANTPQPQKNLELRKRREKINNGPPCISRDWLLQKIDQEMR